MQLNLISRAIPESVPTRVGSAAIVLFPIRLFLGFGWIRAGVEKVIDGEWWTGQHLRTFLAEQQGSALPFMGPLVNALFEPFAELIALAVMGVQLAIGVCLLTTRFLRPALWAGVVLNVVFVAMGAVDPSVFYLVIQLALLAAVARGLFSAPPRVPSALAVGVMLGAAVGLLPLVETIHPAEVIEDPAIILITVALLAAATEALGWFAHDERSFERSGRRSTDR